MRTCRICLVEQTLSSFRSRLARDKRYYYYECKSCYNERSRKDSNLKARRAASRKIDRVNNPDKYRRYELRKRHKITLEAYARKLEEQNGSCAICLGKNFNKNLAIDHDHSCCPGEISCGNCLRGLLCTSCNSGIGNLKDDIGLLRNAIRYLELVKPGVWV